MTHLIRQQLQDLGIIDSSRVVKISDRVRDQDNVDVFRCGKSGVIFLGSMDRDVSQHYSEKEEFSYWGAEDRRVSKMTTCEDDERRAAQFEAVVRGKEWLDVGTGLGGILDLLRDKAARIIAVEPQTGPQDALRRLGFDVVPSIGSVQDESVDVATLFHVFEHLADPIGSLRAIASKMRRGGKIVIEVPHARDALLEWFELEEFRRFTLWSEHLILHTRESLRAFLEGCGFSRISIEGFQRFPLANHLKWLTDKRPNGHVDWAHFRDSDLDASYGKLLAKLDLTDTLIAVATLV